MNAYICLIQILIYLSTKINSFTNYSNLKVHFYNTKLYDIYCQYTLDSEIIIWVWVRVLGEKVRNKVGIGQVCAIINKELNLVYKH